MQTELRPTPARAICDATGLSLAQLSDELGVSQSTARSWSCGRLEMSDLVLRRIAAHFGIELRPLIEHGEVVMRHDGLPLTPQRWLDHRTRQEAVFRGIVRAIESPTPEKTMLHAELSIALRTAAERGQLPAACADVVSYLRGLNS